jgi:hypothetical protein
LRKRRTPDFRAQHRRGSRRQLCLGSHLENFFVDDAMVRRECELSHWFDDDGPGARLARLHATDSRDRDLGGFTIAYSPPTPYMPRFETVNVPPWYSRGSSWPPPLRAR